MRIGIVRVLPFSNGKNSSFNLIKYTLARIKHFNMKYLDKYADSSADSITFFFPLILSLDTKVEHGLWKENLHWNEQIFQMPKRNQFDRKHQKILHFNNVREIGVIGKGTGICSSFWIGYAFCGFNAMAWIDFCLIFWFEVFIVFRRQLDTHISRKFNLPRMECSRDYVVRCESMTNDQI